MRANGGVEDGESVVGLVEVEGLVVAGVVGRHVVLTVDAEQRPSASTTAAEL